MTNEEILANAPKDCTATHYNYKFYLKLNGDKWQFYSFGKWNDMSTFSSREMRSLSDIRRIVELESELKAAATACEMLHKDKEAAERERDEMLGMMATYEREFKAVCRQLIRISNRIMAGEYEDNTPEGMIYSEDAWVDCRWQDVTDPLFTSHNEALNKFAIEQQIKGVNDFANKFCGECDTEYRVQLDSDANYYCNKLRQQLNGDDQ